MSTDVMAYKPNDSTAPTVNDLYTERDYRLGAIRPVEDRDVPNAEYFPWLAEAINDELATRGVDRQWIPERRRYEVQGLPERVVANVSDYSAIPAVLTGAFTNTGKITWRASLRRLWVATSGPSYGSKSGVFAEYLCESGGC